MQKHTAVPSFMCRYVMTWFSRRIGRELTDFFAHTHTHRQTSDPQEIEARKILQCRSKFLLQSLVSKLLGQHGPQKIARLKEHCRPRDALLRVVLVNEKLKKASTGFSFKVHWRCQEKLWQQQQQLRLQQPDSMRKARQHTAKESAQRPALHPNPLVQGPHPTSYPTAAEFPAPAVTVGCRGHPKRS